MIEPDLSASLPTAFTTVSESKTATEPAAPRKPRKKDLKNLTRREGIWYFQKFVNGKREFNGRKTPFSLETPDLTVAKAKRDAILKAAGGAEVDRVLGRQHQHAAKIGQIFESYTRSPTVRANPKTRARNLADLERMIRKVRGDTCEVALLSSTELTWQLVEQWQTIRISEAEQACNGNLAAFEASKRGLNSLLTSIQSIFSKEARSAYRSLYLPPNVEDFATALPVPARKQEAPVHLTDQFVLKLIEQSTILLKRDPGAWVAFQLMTWGGLRNKEALHARKSWLAKTINGYQLSLKATADFVPKGNSRAVIIPSEVAKAILSLQPAATAATATFDHHLVPGDTPTDRTEACYRRLNDWLKAQGVSAEVGKIAYQLRKYFLKKVAVQQHPLMAQVAGGHSSMATTEEHYIGRPKMTEPIRLPTDLSKLLSYIVTEKPLHAATEVGSILSLAQAAQLLEVNAGELAARSEHAESITLDEYVLTVRREGGRAGQLVPFATGS